MHTLALRTAAVSAATRLSIDTGAPTEFIDLTEQVAAFTRTVDLRHGFVNVQSLHTTLAIVVNEHEPLLLTDFVAFLERLAPAHRAYRHDDPTLRTANLSPDERRNGHAHCRALLLPSSAVVNVVNGDLQLGRWQRLFAVELDGPRSRAVSVVAIDGGRR